MIKLTYETDAGTVEATFNSPQELDEFQRQLAEDRKAKACADEEKHALLLKEAVTGFKEVLLRIRDSGLSPEDCIRALETALSELSSPSDN